MIRDADAQNACTDRPTPNLQRKAEATLDPEQLRIEEREEENTEEILRQVDRPPRRDAHVQQTRAGALDHTDSLVS